MRWRRERTSFRRLFVLCLPGKECQLCGFALVCEWKLARSSDFSKRFFCHLRVGPKHGLAATNDPLAPAKVAANPDLAKDPHRGRARRPIRPDRSPLRRRGSRRRRAAFRPARGSPGRPQARPAPPSSATRGSCSRTSAGKPGDRLAPYVGRVRDDDVERPVRALREADLAGSACGRRRHAPRRSPRSAASASSDMSVATARASGNSLRSAIAIAPDPVPRSQIASARAAKPCVLLKHDLDQRFGIRPRHKRRRVELEPKAPELGLAENARDRLAGCRDASDGHRSAPAQSPGARSRLRATSAAMSRPAAAARSSRASSAGVCGGGKHRASLRQAPRRRSSLAAPRTPKASAPGRRRSARRRSRRAPRRRAPCRACRA